MKSKHSHSTLSRRAKTILHLLSLTGLLGAAPSAPGASFSELLEKGIYSEETKGDIDAAMQIYQQIVTEAKGGHATAAQAQYHLGVCYYKKKNYPEATAAFEKLVKEYTDQKELIALAQEYLAGTTVLLPAPWVDGEELRFDLKFPTGFKIGMITCTLNAAEVNGRKIWRLGRRTFAGVQAFSRVEVDADTFRPIHSRWKHSLIGDVETSYAPGRAELKTVGKDGVKKVELGAGVFDNEEALPLMRRLPLADGYKTELRFLSSLAGGAVVPVKVEVTGPEKIEVPAGTYDCYKLELSIHQTFWYSTDPHRYLVKFEAEGVVVELTGVSQRKAGEPVKYQDPSFNFSLTAPTDWLFHRLEREDAKSRVEVAILDPEAVASSSLSVETLENLKPDVRKSVRNWAEQEVADAARTLKDFKIRPDSWKERTANGLSAISVIGDFAEGQEKKIGYGVFIFGDTHASQFHFMIPAKDFEGFKPKFDAILESYQGN